MNKIMMRAFSDELELIKEAGFLRNVGQAIGSFGRLRPGQEATIASNLRNTATSFKHPVDAIKKGWKWTVQDLKGDGLSNKGKMLNRALFVGGNALGAAEVLPDEDPTGRGRTRAERAVSVTAGNIGGLIGAPYGFSGAMLGGVAGGLVGDAAGYAALGHKRKKPIAVTQPITAQQVEQPLSGAAPIPIQKVENA